jgi:hypothetical protein
VPDDAPSSDPNLAAAHYCGFGAADEDAPEPLDGIAVQRVIAVDPEGRIFSAWPYGYSFEAWSVEGARIGGFDGPPLNEKGPASGPWSPDNPPVNMIEALHADSEGRLWVLIWQLRPNFLDAMEEVLGPNGEILLVPANDDVFPLYESRIDLVDLDRAELIGRSTFDGMLVHILPDGRFVEAAQDAAGDLRLVIWEVAFSQ